MRRAALLLLAPLVAACAGYSTGSSSSRPDWCAGVDDATSGLASIGHMAGAGTGTSGDLAAEFKKVSDALGNVALTASGRWQTVAQEGSDAAGRARVDILGSDSVAVSRDAGAVQQAMRVLGPHCGD